MSGRADTGGLGIRGDGVLPAQLLRRAVELGMVEVPDPGGAAVQPASIDLHLGAVAYRLRCSFLPDQDHTVAERLSELVMGELDLTEGAVLETNRPYLIPIVERLDLPDGIRGRTNPKSSTGRIDVLTRVITDHSYRFDEIRPGYRGAMYLEVASNTFTVKVRSGLSLNQLRLAVGRTAVDDEELRAIHHREHLLFHGGRPVPDEQFHTAGGFLLGLDLEGGPRRQVGWRAKRNSRLLDLSADRAHDAADYWEAVAAERGGRIVLEPQQFYLLLSAEDVHIPAHYAAEMAAYDPSGGELRTHYAGFFDPGFGSPDQGLAGSRAALEVRAHDVPFMVQHRQRVARLMLERLVEPSEIPYGRPAGSHYQGQRSTLSRWFTGTTPATV